MPDFVVNLDDSNPHIVQGITMQITLNLAMIMTSLALVGERIILTPRAMIHPLFHCRGATSWQRGCLSHLSLGNMIMCELSDTRLRKLISSCLPPLHSDLTQTWVSVTDFPKFVIGCRHLEKTTCILMVATPTAVGLLTSQDVTQRTRANPITTDLSTLMKGAGTLRIPLMIPQTHGVANDLRVAHLALPVGGWTIEMCRMRNLLVVRPVLPAFHLRGNLARLPRAGLIPHPHPLFAPPESDQNLRPDLPSVLDRLFGLLLILVLILPNLLCECLFSEVTQLANSVVEVAVVNDLACAFRRMFFGTPLHPILHPLQRIQVQMNRGLRIALPFILLSLNDLLLLILLQGLVDNLV